LDMQVGDILDLDAVGRGLDRLRELYRGRRFYRARVYEAVVLHGKGGATLNLPISSGPQYELHLHGNLRIPDDVLLGVAAYDGTETLDAPLEGRLARRIANYYRFKGFSEVKVAPRETRSPNGQRAVLAFDIEE